MQNRPLKTILSEVTVAKGKSHAASGRKGIWQNLRRITGLFLIAVCLVMLFGHLRADAIDPLKSPELKTLKEKLRSNPADESLKQEIRKQDLRLRAQYFRRLSQSSSGVYLILGAATLYLASAGRCAAYRKQPYLPAARSQRSNAKAGNAIARWSVGGVGASVAVMLLGFGLGHGPAVPEQARGEQADATSVAVSDAPSEAELRQNWPRFRGQGGNGVSESTNAPANWDPKAGVGIAWKTPVPAPGFNSPIIWKDHFFFSGGDASKREVFCYDCAKGQLVWRHALDNVPGSPSKAPEIPDTTGYAASTMATDGRRVYVIFATGDVAAFTMQGKLAWAKSFGPLKNPYGYASSLATWHDQLIVLLDQGEPEDGKSKLYALDGRTGQIVWETPRKVGSSWASPIAFETAGKAQVVALSIPWAISYNLADGSELWRVECLNGEVTPSPIFAGGLVFVPSPSEKLLAIRPDGRGDVSKSHVAWSTEENVPDVTSPVSNGELIFTLTTPGLLTCFDAKTGKKLWEHDYEIECHSSPSIADGRVYLFGQKGAAIVVAAAREFKELFRTDMPDVFNASPAFAQEMIIMRGTTNLWGLVKGVK